MKLYIAGGKSLEELKEIESKNEAVLKKVNKFLKRFRTNNFISNGGRIVALVFKDESKVPEHWVEAKKLRNFCNVYIPSHRTAEGKAIRKEMNSEDMKTIEGYSIGEAVGVSFGKHFTLSRHTIPTYGIYCGKYIVGLDDHVTPRDDCQRISDVDYEKLLAKAKKAKPRKNLKTVSR